MIKASQVVRFKAACEENAQIVNHLRSSFFSDLPDPVLDVGAGVGDISAVAFNNRQVIHLDVNDYSVHPIPRDCHKRVQGDFLTFDFTSIPPPKTILLCHVLQFLDGDIAALNGRVKAIDPERVVVVENENDGFMGELVRWFTSRFRGANPEVTVPGFLPWMSEARHAHFSATVSSKSFNKLAGQVSYLMDYPLDDAEIDAVKRFLKSKLGAPRFPINQVIREYRKGV